MTIPEKIEDVQLRLIDLDDQIRTKREQKIGIESRVALDLTSAKDDKGKLILTNEKQREAAIAEFLGANDDWRALYGAERELERTRLRAQAELERLRLEAKFELEAMRKTNNELELKAADARFDARHRAQAVGNGSVQEDDDMPF